MNNSPITNNDFDYIIAGGGMAGLSLAYYMSQSKLLNQKKILILDKERKSKNDRTWCFWERGEQNPFEKIIHHKWRKLDFFGVNFSTRYELKKYFYKMIRGNDFYQFVGTQLLNYTNITFIQEPIVEIKNTDTGATVKTESSAFTTNYVFDSVFQPDFYKAESHFLMQHFKGLVLTTSDVIFDETCVTLHDFRIEQQGDAARFFYVLPLSSTKALVEYTVFSPQLLTEEQYNNEIRIYIQKKLGISTYTIQEEEFGVIPMSDASIATHDGKHVIRIGTSGGYVRPSTGYTFARTQRYLQSIVRSLELGKSPIIQPSWFSRRFSLYDSIMLNVLVKKRYSGADFFTQLYRKNSIENIFDFLDEQSTPLNELKIMSTVPLSAFTKAAADVVLHLH